MGRPADRKPPKYSSTRRCARESIPATTQVLFFEPCRAVAVSIVRDVYIIVLSRTVRILYDTSGQPSLYSTEYDNSGDLSEPINSMLAYVRIVFFDPPLLISPRVATPYVRRVSVHRGT
jgi:hypothetical protein